MAKLAAATAEDSTYGHIILHAVVVVKGVVLLEPGLAGTRRKFK
jgi:hypothetical protein